MCKFRLKQNSKQIRQISYFAKLFSNYQYRDTAIIPCADFWRPFGGIRAPANILHRPEDQLWSLRRS